VRLKVCFAPVGVSMIAADIDMLRMWPPLMNQTSPI
jgi:hypothetical protein